MNNFIRSPRNGVKLIGKTYVSTHLKHFSKYEAAFSELPAAFESFCMPDLSVHIIVPFQQNT